MTIERSDALFLLDRLPDLVLLLDDGGFIRYANRRSMEVLGNEDLPIGKAFRDLVDERDLARLPQQPKDWVNWHSPQGFPWEIRIRRGDGQMQLVSGNAEELPLTSQSEADANLQGILIALRPIGEPNSINIRRDLLIAAVEAADSSIVIADMSEEDFPLMYVNQGFLELTGYNKTEVIGQNCRFLQLCDRNANFRDDEQPELAQIREALKTGRSTNVIIRNYRHDGSLFYNDLYLTPVYEQERLVAFIGVQNDVTLRVQAQQQQLKERERTLSSFFAATDSLLGIVELSPSAPIRHVLLNDRAAEFFQVEETAKEIFLASGEFPPEIKAQWQEAFEQCWQTQKVVRLNCEIERLGQHCHLQVTINPIEIEPEATPRCCYVAEDLTDFNIAEANLMLMKAAVENIEESVVITTSKLDRSENEPQIIYVNKAFTEITGYKPEEAIGQTPRILQGDLSDPRVLDRLRQRLTENQSFQGETINYRKDGRPFIVEWNIASIPNKEQEVAYWVAAQRDITRRRQLEKEVLEIQGREQERIARDLHDSIQHKLNVIGMLAGLIKYQLNETLDSELKELINRLIDTTQQASQETRDIAHSLHPINIEKNGLTIALQHLAVTTQELFDISCEFTYEQFILVSDRAIATHLYRIAQEAINNAIRHGRVTQILIGLATKHLNSDEYTLTISDNGVGISDEALQAEEGIGLNSMRYRAKIINGNLNIERGKNGGTVVTCTFECQNIVSETNMFNNSSSES